MHGDLGSGRQSIHCFAGANDFGLIAHGSAGSKLIRLVNDLLHRRTQVPRAHSLLMTTSMRAWPMSIDAPG
ncbi:hypothetical protein [Streptomyces achromogenes]|uniref:hypothetical protein n=1 Tax=Streptomyces achromogenes TaxID=67255 RepID=UPI00367F4BCB